MKVTQGRQQAGLLLGVLVAIALLALVVAGASAQVVQTEWGVPTANAEPGAISSDSSGNLWFVETAGNNIAKITQTGAIQEFSIPTANAQPWGIWVEANGRVWFTESNASKIGNMPSGGSISEDSIPTANSQPRGIVVDSSTNVWFAESNGNKIGKMNQYGSFTEYGVPTSNSQPWGIALDASNNVWFTERSGNKIGKLSTSGAPTVEYSVPTLSSGPMGITIDPSGNIWFAEYDANKIGMMTQAGVFTEYSLSSNVRPVTVYADRAGVIWYTGFNSNTFGKIANGANTDYGVPTANSGPYGITVDGSGNVWVTEQTANRIAKSAGLAPLPTATPTVTSTPAATATAVPTPIPPPPAPRDSRYFSQTGFRIDNDVFWDYFNKRGGINTFGYPISRTFPFLGFTTQFFQRSIMQIGPNGNAQTMNVLDPGLMPYTRINGSTFPAPDSYLSTIAPAPGSQDYDVRVQQFIMNYAPNQFEGLNVNFYQAFVNTVKLESAFPEGGGNPGLVPLLNLELWGVPTSRPQRDPNNGNFVYLRFQRGIMHFDATNGLTQGLLLADYLKSIITGSNLPSDLAAQANGSAFYLQYNTAKLNWVDRPDQLPGTNLTFAFDKQ